MDRRNELVEIIEGNSWFMDVLRAVRELPLSEWCIGAGVIRNIVWDHLHSYSTPSPLADADAAFFDLGDLGRERDYLLQAQLAREFPDVPWEVTNQAGVHLWFEEHFGYPVEALQSLHEAVASWPETATSVGVRLTRSNAIEVFAPLGLDDLFGMIVRRNPKRVSEATYLKRIADKRYLERWPQVRIVGCRCP
jgi:hypothetical protein